MKLTFAITSSAITSTSMICTKRSKGLGPSLPPIPLLTKRYCLPSNSLALAKSVMSNFREFLTQFLTSSGVTASLCNSTGQNSTAVFWSVATIAGSFHFNNAIPVRVTSDNTTEIETAEINTLFFILVSSICC